MKRSIVSIVNQEVSTNFNRISNLNLNGLNFNGFRCYHFTNHIESNNIGYTISRRTNHIAIVQLKNNRGIRTPVQLRTFSRVMKEVEEGVSELNLRNQDNTEELINAALAAGTLKPLNEDGTEKSRNQLKNELKKAAKLEKFNAKQSKVKESDNKGSKEGASSKMKTLAKKSPEIDEVLLKVAPGDMKPMDGPMADSYSPKAVEACWYAWWEKEKFFNPDFNPNKKKEGAEKFVMVVPPPNVTGSLHLGHTLTAAVEDSLSRWHRMKGHDVLYIPGSDHAGIATQAVVEKRIKKERGLTKHDMGRDAFLAEVWKWRDTYGDRIYDQFRRMGNSVDWDRVCFTLDPKAVVAVNEAFCRLFDDGLIFRANRLVHWSGKLKTALSDLEVEMREIEPRSRFPAHGHDPKKTYEFGVMSSFAYRLEGSDDKEIVISTTRPETVFADVAIAVNPTDERYTEFHGKNLVHPVTGSLIPVICDEAADPQFGTGALKVSPAHDHTDFEIGRRHGLPCISIFDENNVLLPICGTGFADLPRYEAREAVLNFCKANGTFRGDEAHPMTLPICTRSGDFVEPRMMPQWWLNCKQMAADAVDSVRSGELTISPKEYEREWFFWLENIRDWCLSRQLWWGHRVPAYRVIGSGNDHEETWVAGRSEEEALEKARVKYPGNSNLKVIQDDDVLDTWFSSGLWPLTTLNWPDTLNTDFQRFYPQNILETGSDILFFWVARMVMLGKYLTGKLPFNQILLHAMVRDAYGRKMSKSLGNVIDPVDVIEGCSLEALQSQLDGGNLDPSEVTIAKAGQKRDFPNGIPECGTDALRFALCSYVAQGRDINLNITRVEGYRRFCNKLWNAMKFALMKLGPDFRGASYEMADLVKMENILPVDLWMLSKIARASELANKNFSSFNLMNVTTAIHQLWLYELCDVYIEAVKPILSSQESSQRVLFFALEQGLKLLHPMMPFITEELYHRLPRGDQGSISICVSSYPELEPLSLPSHVLKAEEEFDQLFELIKSVRSTVMDRKLAPKTTKLFLFPSSTDLEINLSRNESALQALVRTVGSIVLINDISDGQGEMIELIPGDNEKLKCTIFIDKV